MISRKETCLKIAAALVALAATASCSTVAKLAGLKKPDADIPVVRVSREPVEAKIHLMGELGPSRSAMIVAPPAGGVLQIVSIARTGTLVKKDDIVVQFDPSEQEYNLEQSKSQLEEAEQQIRKMKADQAVRVAQERVTLLKAQYDVKRAEFKVKGNELLSGIEARKNVIALEEAKRKLEQLQRDLKSRADSDAADLIVQNVARTKAMMGMKMAQQFIDNMTVRSPVGGVVVEGHALQHEGESSAGGVETEVEALARGQVALVAQALDLQAQASDLGIVGLRESHRRGRPRGGHERDGQGEEEAGAHQ